MISLYVDDIITREYTVDQVHELIKALRAAVCDF